MYKKAYATTGKPMLKMAGEISYTRGCEVRHPKKKRTWEATGKPRGNKTEENRKSVGNPVKKILSVGTKRLVGNPVKMRLRETL